ncbi:MAG: signal peptidase II [Clostridium sp.]|jgi:signal peptidase II|nr:signal peptidase II [Clostridium sp.]
MVWIIIVLIIAFDQITKFVVINNIEFGDRITIIDNFFHLAHWRNTGAAWGILQNGKYVLIPVTILMMLLMAYFMHKYNNRILRFSLSMVIGGAWGNLIDRVFRPDGVVDFLDFQFGSYHFPTFNVADSFVVVGTIILAYYMFFVHKDKDELDSKNSIDENIVEK